MKEIVLETANYLEIKYACQDALINHKMISIIGDAGLGKTTAINSFKKLMKDNVYIVTVTEAMSMKIFYSSILNTFGDESYITSQHIYFIIKSAIEQFNSNGENKLLIIDEADKLSPRMVRYLHEFRDGTKETTGIIMLGVNTLKKNLQKWRNSGIVGIPEYYSRIHSWHELNKPTKDEIKGIISAYKIDDEDFISANINVKTFRRLCYNIEDYLTLLAVNN